MVITNKISEIDRDRDGKIDVRIETLYRGKMKVMMTVASKTQMDALLLQGLVLLGLGVHVVLALPGKVLEEVVIAICRLCHPRLLHHGIDRLCVRVVSSSVGRVCVV